MKPRWVMVKWIVIENFKKGRGRARLDNYGKYEGDGASGAKQREDITSKVNVIVDAEDDNVMESGIDRGRLINIPTYLSVQEN